MCLGMKRRSRPWEPAPWRLVVKDELQREVVRGHLGLGQHWAVAPPSAWDTGGTDMKKQLWGMWGRQAAASGRFSLVPATSRFSAPFTHACVRPITTKNMTIFVICHPRNYYKPSQFSALPVQERWDEKYWLCAHASRRKETKCRKVTMGRSTI